MGLSKPEWERGQMPFPLPLVPRTRMSPRNRLKS